MEILRESRTIDIFEVFIYNSFIMAAKKRIGFFILYFLFLNFGLSSLRQDNNGNLSPENSTTGQPVSAQQLVENIKNKKYSGEPRNFILKDSSFKDLVLGLSEYSGINMVIDPGISGTISCYLKKVPWDQALAVFLKQYNLTITAEGNIIRIHKKAAKNIFTSLFFKILLLSALIVTGLLAFVIYKKKSRTNAVDLKKTPLNHQFAREYAKKLTFLLETKKVFRNENLSVQLLAKELAIPTYQLSRIINEHMSKTFSELINHYRIEEAKELLTTAKESDQKILGIGYDVGFSTKTSFNKVFKKYTLMTPTEFRKKQTKSG
jgi:AraC-like DNA-binding protein